MRIYQRHTRPELEAMLKQWGYTPYRYKGYKLKALRIIVYDRIAHKYPHLRGRA